VPFFNIYRVLHFKHNPNYSNICKLWWHQYNTTNKLFFSFYLLGSTYRTVLQQMLKMSITFLKTSIHPFYCVSCDFVKCFWVSVGNSLFNIFSSSKLHGVFKSTLSLKNPHRKKCLWICHVCTVHSFCTAGMSSGLATRVTWVWVSQWRLEDFVT
jgi:hypothetical protein